VLRTTTFELVQQFYQATEIGIMKPMRSLSAHVLISHSRQHKDNCLG